MKIQNKNAQLFSQTIDSNNENYTGTTKESQIKESEERFRSLVESSPNGIVLTDHDGTIRLVNRQIEVLFGYERNELIGKAVEILLPERFHKNHVGYRQGFFHEPQTRPMGIGRDLYAKHKLGHEIPVEIGLTTLHSKDKLMILSTIVDITERKKNEENLKQKNIELARFNEELKSRTSQLIQSEKMSALGTLIAGVAHELNNPITGILNYAQYCKKNMPPDGKLNDVLDDLVSEAKRCAEIVSNLLTYSYWTSASVDTKSETSNIGEIIKRVIHLFAYLLTDIEFKIEIENNMPDLCIAKNKLQQVLSNLIKNAIDSVTIATNKKIYVHAFYDDSWCYIAVEDTGEGISEEGISKIFDPFYTTKDVGKGSGLGLSVSKSIIEEFEGEISVDSKIGEGARFMIKFPHCVQP